uniref:F-box domain-containing protein n=1 Tax=Setaria italica TaxID=4555 RepID=K3YD67_SETIT
MPRRRQRLHALGPIKRLPGENAAWICSSLTTRARTKVRVVFSLDRRAAPRPHRKCRAPDLALTPASPLPSTHGMCYERLGTDAEGTAYSLAGRRCTALANGTIDGHRRSLTFPTRRRRSSHAMGVRSRSKRRRRAAAASGGGADLISGLGDDVLVRVLELLPDTRHAVRTAALSRRWRGLWTRVPALRFNFAPATRRKLSGAERFPSFVNNGTGRRCKGAAGAAEARRFLSFVDNALARRAHTDAAAALEHLAISFPMDPSVAGQQAKQLAAQCIKASQEWIWYAMRSGVKSFVLELSVPLRDYRRQISREGDKHQEEGEAATYDGSQRAS